MIIKIDSNNIEQAIPKINNDKEYFKTFNEPQLKYHQKLYFDINSRILACIGEHSVLLMHINDKTSSISKPYFVDNLLFDPIINIQLVSSSDKEFKMEVACK